MSFPVVAASAITDFSADQTSHVVNLPSGITSGDLLLLWFTMDGVAGNTVATPSGWTLVVDSITATNSDKGCLFSKVASGSEGSTVTVTSTGTAQSSACVALRITGASSVEGQDTSSPGSLLGIVLTPLTPTASSKALLISCVNTAGNRDTSDHAGGATVVKTTASGATTNTVATVAYSQLSISSDLETVIGHGMRQSSSTAFSGAVVVVHGGSLGGNGMFLMGCVGQTGIGQF